MMHYAYDTEGELGEVGNIAMWVKFAAWMREQGGVLQEFADAGMTEQMDACARALEQRTAADPETELSRQEMIAMLRQAKDVLIVGQETEPDGGDDVEQALTALRRMPR